MAIEMRVINQKPES